MMPKRRKPTHPGQVLLEDFLKPLSLTSRQFADKLGGDWSEVRVEAIIKEKEYLSPKAIKEFAETLGTTTYFWEHLQNIRKQWEQLHHHNEKGSLKPWKKAQ